MEQVKLYDTTLRDGMAGEGMSLSAPRRCASSRRSTRSASTSSRPASPAPTRRRSELFGLLAELELEQATICAFGMTRRRGVAAEDDAGLRTLVECFAPVVCLVGKTWGAAPGEGDQGLPRGEPGDDRRLGRLLPRARASASSTTPSTSSTASATTPAYALECLRAAVRRGRRERHPLRHQRLQPARPGRRRHRAGRRRAGRRRSRSASTPTTTPSAGSPTRWRRCARAPASCRGRSTATASAAATPTSSRSCRRCS